jgi:hypothetical protein
MKNNKLLFFIVLLISAIVTGGCSKDNAKDIVGKDIVGKWEVIAYGMDEDNMYNFTYGSPIKFQSDGTCITGDEDVVTSTYTMDDEFIYITDIVNPDISDKHRYIFSDKNTLRLDYIEGHWDYLWSLNPKIKIYKRIK